MYVRSRSTPLFVHILSLDCSSPLSEALRCADGSALTLKEYENANPAERDRCSKWPTPGHFGEARGSVPAFGRIAAYKAVVAAGYLPPLVVCIVQGQSCRPAIRFQITSATR